MNNTTYTYINFSEVAARLVDAGYRFIKVKAREKAALETGWTKKQNYIGTEKTFVDWIESGGNYGVMGDYEHIIIDTDNEELTSLLDQLPETFTVQSGSGRGLHTYYRCKNEKPMRLVSPENHDVNLGDIQSKGKMVVGPGSIHPSGGTYNVVKDIPVAEVDIEDIKRVFSDYIVVKSPVTSESVREGYREHCGLFDSITLSDVGCYPMNPKQMNASGEIQGAHPLHGSSTGENFAINIQKNTWHCYRCDSGGGPLEWLAVTEGIISCEDAGPGCLRGDTFLRVLDIARNKGLNIPSIHPTRITRPRILESIPDYQYDPDNDDNSWGLNPDPDDAKIVTLDELPDMRPDHATVLIDAPPRLGKTHHVISKWVARDSRGANVITTSHSIVGHHLSIFKKYKNIYSTAVHMEGKDRCCKSGDKSTPCQDCPLYPYDEDNFMELRRWAKEHLNVVKVLTKDNCPSNVCPYYFIKMSEPFADFVFTVSQNMDRISTREHWVFDEDPTIGHFFAESAPILEVSFHGHHISASSVLEEKWANIQKYKLFLEGGKKTKGRKTILRVIEILEQIRALIPLENISRSVKSTLLEELNTIDMSVALPEDISPYKLIETVRRNESGECLSPFVEALLFQYDKRKFMWTGDSPATLHIVADGERITRPLPDGKVTIIGNTRAELFIRSLIPTRPDYKVIRINSFPFSQWFVLCVIKDTNRKTGRKVMEKLLTQHNDVNDLKRHPVLVLTGSEKDQSRLHKMLGGISHCSNNEEQIGQLWNFTGGYINLFYQNSVISRGIDVDFYTDIYIYSSDFANPYWQARLLAAIDDEDTEDEEFVRGILDLIIMDETTNSLLRISPVRKTNDGLPRMVYINEMDLWKVKPYVLDDMQQVEVTDAILEEVRVRVRSAHGNCVYLDLGQDDDDGSPSYHSGVSVRFDRRNDRGCPDPELVARDISELEERKYSDWKKSYNLLDLDMIEKAIRKRLVYLRDTGGNRTNELKLIQHLMKNVDGRYTKIYTPENISRILRDMIISGEIIRDGPTSVETPIMLREKYEKPDFGGFQQFSI